MQTVWEARFLNSQFLTAMAISIVVIIMSIVLFVKIHNAYTGLIRCACIIVFVLAFVFCISTLFSAYDDWHYAKNNQFVVEGIVENFSTGNNGSDSFSVNGVYFLCTPVDNNLFAYTLSKRDPGSVINENGQYVRLTYCSQNGLNGILKIETSTEESTNTDDSNKM